MTFRVELRVRNAPLYREIHAKYKNVSQFCVAHELQPSVVGDLLNLKRNPLLSTLEWSAPALAIADALGVLPEDIFPEACQVRLETTKTAFEMSAPQVAMLMEEASPLRLVMDVERVEDVAEALKTLTAREQDVIRRRFGFDGGEGETCASIASSLGISVGRVQQIEHKAIRKLRHPQNSDVLREHLEEAE